MINVLFAVAILVPSLWGFGDKFREFVLLARGDVDGVFAVTPVINYLLASFGFLLLVWLGGGQRHVPRHRAAEANDARERSSGSTPSSADRCRPTSKGKDHA